MMLYPSTGDVRKVSRQVFSFDVILVYLAATAGLAPFPAATFEIKDLLMWGMTPPPAMVALTRVSSSSSPRMASIKWRGVTRLTLRSLAAFPASSRTSAVRYSRMADA